MSGTDLGTQHVSPGAVDHGACPELSSPVKFGSLVRPQVSVTHSEYPCATIFRQTPPTEAAKQWDERMLQHVRNQDTRD